MDWKNQLTKTPYLVLFIVLISIGVGTASALITITLSGNVVITGDTTLQGDLTCTGCVDSSDIKDGTITGNDVSTNFIKIVRVNPGPCVDVSGFETGWCPDNSKQNFRIIDNSLSLTDVVAITVIGDFVTQICFVNSITILPSGDFIFNIRCDVGPVSVSKLNYAIFSST